MGTERNMTEIQLSELGFKLEASITAMLESQSSQQYAASWPRANILLD